MYTYILPYYSYGECGNIILNTNTILSKCVHTSNDWVKWAFFITNKKFDVYHNNKVNVLPTFGRWLEV